jgi:hypothetical protein
MILSSLVFIAILVERNHAFVPTSLTKHEVMTNSIRRRTTDPLHKRRHSSLLNEKTLAEPAEPQDDVNNMLGQNLFDESIEIPLIMETTGMDQGKDILLDTIANNKPEDLIPIDISEQVTSLFSDDNLDTPLFDETLSDVAPVFDEALPDIEQTLIPSSNSNILSGTEYADFSDSSNLSEDVKAVLEASEAAVAEAEASMPSTLIDQLDFSATTAAASNITAITMSTPLVVDEIPEILSASSVVGEAVTSTKIESPGVSKILKFAIPAIGVWLCGPLLSLIDTSAVGLFSGTVQQAALNPAVAVTDYAALLIVSISFFKPNDFLIFNSLCFSHASFNICYFRRSCTLAQPTLSQLPRRVTGLTQTSQSLPKP